MNFWLIKAIFLTVLLVVGMCFIVGPVSAACTDTPAPGVNWHRCYLDNRNFKNVDLTGAVLRGAFFARSDLSESIFTEIDGRRSKFVAASLNNVIFHRARLVGADFTNSELINASFKEADLRRAKFFRANLKGADFSKAILNKTDFLKANLSGAIWIDGKTVCSEGSIGQCN